MERWERPVRHHYKENPSFSSTLLDAIYRSIDDPESKREEELMICRETMRSKKSSKGGDHIKEKELQRACTIEKWMEKKHSYGNVDTRRKSVADILDKKPQRKEFDSVLLNSSSTSSESSCGGGFSSSESESIYGTTSLTSRSSSTYTMPRPKPIKTSISQASETERYNNQYQSRNVYAANQKPKGNSFVKTKSKALKIYGDLKKAKQQPISPGGRLASFLHSIFTSSNPKKAKLSSSSAGFDERKLMNKSVTEPGSTCSSASSFSRSCLSKTPSSSGKLSSTKRSVRFYPVSVIVDEDCRPCGHKNLYGSEENIMAISTKRSSSTNEELKYRVMSENRRVEEVARDLLKNYQKKEVNMRDVIICNDSEEEEDDDIASCASSDLFELDNLSVIGIERYREELPVYETTHLSTNRAIADGLIL